MVRVAWKEMMHAYEDRWIDIPDSDIESLLMEHPDFEEEDIRDWISDNMWDYDTQYGDVEYGESIDTCDMTIDEYGELDGIIKDFKENHEDEEDEEETNNTFIGVL